MKLNKILILCKAILLIAVANFSYCQPSIDTAALVKEFNKVMSFAVQPYLHYTTTTKLRAEPVLQAEDTVSSTGIFYKNRDELYYSNGAEEMFLEDSLLVQINNERKTIWISKVDISSKEKMDVLPLSNKHLQELFRKKYSISKTITNEGNYSLNFEAHQNVNASSATNTRISLEYTPKTLLPKIIELEIQMQEVADDETLAALKNENINEASLVQSISGVRYIVRKQWISLQFENIDDNKEKAGEIPSWKERLNYTTDFTGKGKYKEYELTKTF